MKNIPCLKLICWEYAVRERRRAAGLSFEFGQYYDTIFIAMGGLCWCEISDVSVGEGCVRGILCKADFGYQLIIRSRNETSHKSLPSWPVVGSSGCTLTSN